MNTQTVDIELATMTWSSCISDEQRAIGKLDGVGSVAVALQSGAAAGECAGAGADTVRKGFLEFERWWSSYCFLSLGEILPFAAVWARQTRQPVSDDNPWHASEQTASKAIGDALEQGRVQRDAGQEQLFAQLYGRT